MQSKDSSSEESTDEEEVLRDFEQEAQLVIEERSLPKKSVDRYKLVYDTFLKWKDENKADSFQESIMICYFKDLQKKVCPATAWSVWSILKKMLNTRHNIDISNYLNLKSILKNNSKCYKPKKSLTFNWNEITTFINDSSDQIFLGAKVLLIFGIYGALRCAEFVNIQNSHVEDLVGKSKFLVSVHDTKTDIDRSFVIGPLFYSKVQEYISLRPSGEFTDRFFIQYLNGKCHRQVIGKNKVGSTPSVIASHLGLKNPSKYTGHCYRRTSATLLSNSGANMPMIKQLGGWRSDAVANGYIAESMKSKDLIYKGIIHESKHTADTVLAKPSTSRENLPYLNDSNNTNVAEIKEVADLKLSYEDFCDEDFCSASESADNRINELNSTVNFSTANGKLLPPVTLKDKNKNYTSSKLFTSKSSVKLSFIKSSKFNTSDQPASKKIRIEQKSADAENVKPIDDVQKNLVMQNSVVKFDNCTITGNITNNYYYYENS